MKLVSRVWLFSTPWSAAYQAPLSMGFSRQEWGAIAFSRPTPTIFQNSYSKCLTTFSTFLPKYLAGFSNPHTQNWTYCLTPSPHIQPSLLPPLCLLSKNKTNIMVILTKLLVAFLNPIFPWYLHTETHSFLPTLFYGHFPFSHFNHKLRGATISSYLNCCNSSAFVVAQHYLPSPILHKEVIIVLKHILL